MSRPNYYAPVVPMTDDDLRELSLVSVWFRLLTISTAVFIGSLIAILTSDVAIPTAIPWSVVGAVATAFTWRRMWEAAREPAAPAVKAGAGD